MGEFFKDENKKTAPRDEQLILDFNELCATYRIVENKIQETTNQAYEAILPTRTELIGAGSTPDDIGQIGDVRRRIQQSRLFRTDVGIKMFNALKNIEDLNN
jgi:hypothetical protein